MEDGTRVLERPTGEEPTAGTGEPQATGPSKEVPDAPKPPSEVLKEQIDVHSSRVEGDDEASQPNLERQGAEDALKAEQAEAEVEKESTAWKFRIRDYWMILPWIDESAELMPSGRKPRQALTVNNWTMRLNLRDENQARIHKKLLSDDRRGVDFWLLEDIDTEETTVVERAGTLKSLDRCSVAELQSMLTADEAQEAGITPSCSDKYELMMAIIDRKHLSRGD